MKIHPFGADGSAHAGGVDGTEADTLCMSMRLEIMRPAMIRVEVRIRRKINDINEE